MWFFKRKVTHNMGRVVHMKHLSTRCRIFVICSCGAHHPIILGKVDTSHDARTGYGK